MNSEKRSNFYLRKVNIVICAGIIVLCTTLFLSVLLLHHEFYGFSRHTENSNEIYEAAINLQDASEYLSEQARLFVLTQNFTYIKNYFEEKNVSKQMENAIERLQKLGEYSTSYIMLTNAYNFSAAVRNQEFYAMKLVLSGMKINENLEIPQELKNTVLSDNDLKLTAEDRAKKAADILFSSDYMKNKNRITENKVYSIKNVFWHKNKALHVTSGSIEATFYWIFISILAITGISLFFYFLVRKLVLSPLYKHVKSIQAGEKLKLVGSREFQFLAESFNEILEQSIMALNSIKKKAEHDELTGVINRTGFSEIQETLSHYSKKIAMVIIDVDKFKDINDTYGHKTGDLVLKSVAQILTESFAPEDYVARIGGDEFSAIVMNFKSNPEEQIKNILETVKQKLATLPATLPKTTVSMGAAFSEYGFTQFLFEETDKALYYVKENGRNNYKLFSEL